MKTKLLPDCARCIFRDTCERYEPGIFCTSYRSKPAPSKDKHSDPNYKWQHGEDAEF